MEIYPKTLESQLEEELLAFRDGMFKDRQFFRVISLQAGLRAGVTPGSPELNDFFCEPAGDFVDPDKSIFNCYVRFGRRDDPEPQRLHILTVNKFGFPKCKLSPDLEAAYKKAGVEYNNIEGNVVSENFLSLYKEITKGNPALRGHLDMGRDGIRVKHPEEVKI